MDARKRMRNDAGSKPNGGLKKSKQETESGVGVKSKPCTKFFSKAGCPFGEGCHFLHYFPGGYNAVTAQMTKVSTAMPPVSRVPQHLNGSNSSGTLSLKSKICNKFNTTEGCKYGDKCNFAHGEWEIGKPSHNVPHSTTTRQALNHMGGARIEPPPPPPSQVVPGSTTTFGASATAKISVDASLAGAIIGKGGVHSKQICRQTGAKLSIRDHESDPNLKNIELEGTFEQIQLTSAMVRELILKIGPTAAISATSVIRGASTPKKGNKKTKLCENFTKGSCTFGESCHFAHGEEELRKPGV